MTDKQRINSERARTPEVEAAILRWQKVFTAMNNLENNPAIARITVPVPSTATMSQYSPEVQDAVEALAADRDQTRLDTIRQDIAVMQSGPNPAEHLRVLSKPNEELSHAA